MSTTQTILFTAFEPSGDEHAAPIIAELLKVRPDLKIHAMGGPKMQAAGATLIEHTVGDAAMLGSAIRKIQSHRKLLGRLETWIKANQVHVHVPTDSPAANWAICKMVKRIWGDKGARVVHMVAPQVWAWASWRVRRLQKWSDRVLCLLPFEPDWFRKHEVDARFIGHPVFDEPLDLDELARLSALMPTGDIKLALLPGSRPGEIAKNGPIITEVFRRLSKIRPEVVGVVASLNAESADRYRSVAGELPETLTVVDSQTEAVLHWADVVLTVSGTATLHVARHHKPMAIVYAVSPISWNLVGRWLMNTRTFTLPNLIALNGPSTRSDAHIVREFIPFHGDVQPIVDEMTQLIDEPEKRNRQIDALRRITAPFLDLNAGEQAAHAILEFL